MSYDFELKCYWCDKCGNRMRIDWTQSSDQFLWLECTHKCGFERQFMAAATCDTEMVPFDSEAKCEP